MNVNEAANVRELTAVELDAVNGGVAPAVGIAVLAGAAALGSLLGYLTAKQDDLGPVIRETVDRMRAATGRR